MPLYSHMQISDHTLVVVDSAVWKWLPSSGYCHWVILPCEFLRCVVISSILQFRIRKSVPIRRTFNQPNFNWKHSKIFLRIQESTHHCFILFQSCSSGSFFFCKTCTRRSGEQVPKTHQAERAKRTRLTADDYGDEGFDGGGQPARERTRWVLLHASTLTTMDFSRGESA